MEERKAGTNSRCPFYRGVHLIEVSVKRESTVHTNLFENHCGFLIYIPFILFIRKKDEGDEE